MVDTIKKFVTAIITWFFLTVLNIFTTPVKVFKVIPTISHMPTSLAHRIFSVFLWIPFGNIIIYPIMEAAKIFNISSPSRGSGHIKDVFVRVDNEMEKALNVIDTQISKFKSVKLITKNFSLKENYVLGYFYGYLDSILIHLYQDNLTNETRRTLILTKLKVKYASNGEDFSYVNDNLLNSDPMNAGYENGFLLMGLIRNIFPESEYENKPQIKAALNHSKKERLPLPFCFMLLTLFGNYTQSKC